MNDLTNQPTLRKRERSTSNDVAMTAGTGAAFIEDAEIVQFDVILPRDFEDLAAKTLSDESLGMVSLTLNQIGFKTKT